MKPATWPRDRPEDERLLVVDGRAGALSVAAVRDLPSLLDPGDVVVLNDAATMPASIEVTHPAHGAFELRLAGGRPPVFFALVLGDGTSAVPTEDRGPPPRLASGDVLELAPAVRLVVEEMVDEEGRLVVVRLAGSAQALFRALYARGKPVQYAHVSAPLPLHHVQTAFAGPPMAAEIPSAGRPVTFGLLSALRRRGVAVARLSHAAGLSSTGSAAADRFLPLPERYVIPEATAAAVVAARERGGRVVAVGTTVARALEAAWRAGGRSARGEIAAGEGTAVLVMDEGTERGIVDAILTGVHEPGTSHYRLLRAFTGAALLDQSLELAEREGFLVHEFGDSVLVVARERARARAAA